MKMTVDKNARLALAHQFQAERARNAERTLWYAEQILQEAERVVAAPALAQAAALKEENLKALQAQAAMNRAQESAKAAAKRKEQREQEAAIAQAAALREQELDAAFAAMPLRDKIALRMREIRALGGFPRDFTSPDKGYIRIFCFSLNADYADIVVHNNPIWTDKQFKKIGAISHWDEVKWRVTSETLFQILCDIGFLMHKRGQSFHTKP